MSNPATVFTFGTWSAPEAPVAIEYPLEILEELRAAACDGFQRFTRGGLEVGGVLFGTLRENAVRIVTWRPISCDHAYGPTFVLSQKDREDLARLLDSASGDPELHGLQPIGWFLSHTRSGISLSTSDLEIYSHFFPEAWQVTLVLHPEKLGACRAGFFVRDSNGEVRSESSYVEFSVETVFRAVGAPVAPGPPRAAPSAPVPVPKSNPLPPVAPQRPVLQAPPPINAPAAPTGRARSSRYRWGPWLILICLAATVGFLLIKDESPSIGVRRFSLRIADRGEQLLIEWDKQAASIHKAHSASVEINDGGTTERVGLTPQQLQDGVFSYTRHSGDVSARMMFFLENGSSVEETARYLGPPVAPPPPSAEVLALRAERDQLQVEVERLRQQLRKDKGRSSRRSSRR